MALISLSTVFGEPNFPNIAAAIMKFCSASLYLFGDANSVLMLL